MYHNNLDCAYLVNSVICISIWKTWRPKKSMSPNSQKKIWCCPSAKTKTGRSGSKLLNRKKKLIRGPPRKILIEISIVPNMILLYLMLQVSWTCQYSAFLNRTNQISLLQMEPWRSAIWGSTLSKLYPTTLKDLAKTTMNTSPWAKKKVILHKESRMKHRGRDLLMAFHWKITKTMKSRLAFET